MKKRDFLTLADFSSEEILDMLDEAVRLKQKMDNNEIYTPLKGRSASMIFQKRSTRTRVSTETGISYLGGHALFLGMDDIQLGKNETLKDTARVLCRYNDVIMARVFGHETLEELSEESTSPIVNLLSDKYHPLQILADLMTIRRNFGELKGLTLAWVGDGNNVLHSLMVACPKLGMNIKIATPKNYSPLEEVIEISKKEALENNVEFVLTEDPVEAVKNANIIVTDTWISMGQDDEYQARVKAFDGYQVNMEMLSNASDDWIFLHCLPRKPHEVDDEVFYSNRSLVWEEAENRMYTVMAVVLKMLNLS